MLYWSSHDYCVVTAISLAARVLLAERVQMYNKVRLHSALQYITPWDYHRGDAAAQLTERRTKLKVAQSRVREAWEAFYAAGFAPSLSSP